MLTHSKLFYHESRICLFSAWWTAGLNSLSGNFCRQQCSGSNVASREPGSLPYHLPITQWENSCTNWNSPLFSASSDMYEANTCPQSWGDYQADDKESQPFQGQTHWSPVLERECLHYSYRVAEGSVCTLLRNPSTKGKWTPHSDSPLGALQSSPRKDQRKIPSWFLLRKRKVTSWKYPGYFCSLTKGEFWVNHFPWEKANTQCQSLPAILSYLRGKIKSKGKCVCERYSPRAQAQWKHTPHPRALEHIPHLLLLRLPWNNSR